MTAELHLPDLPEVAITLGKSGLSQPRRPWDVRLRDGVSTYLPLLLMALLALATWWLVKNTPGALPAQDRDPARQEPDYTMRSFTLQRFAPDGHLRVHLEGSELRHYPGGDRLEVDSVNVHAVAPDGRITLATAQHAVSNGDANRLQLNGGAEVTSVDASDVPIVIRSEFLEALLDTDVVRTDRPVQVLQGRNVVRAAGLVYDHRRRQLELKGPMRAVLQVPGR